MYQLEERIGKGGMGKVRKAKHELLTRPADIKLIRSEALAGGSGNGLNSLVTRFQREAQITANLRSPHPLNSTTLE